MNNDWKEKIKPYLMVAPAMFGIAVFTIYPVIRLISWSFYKVNLLNSAKNVFVGLDNFVKIFNNRQFIRSIENTATYSFWTIIFIMGLALVMAMWFSSNQNKLSKFTQAAVFLPHIISSVSISLIFSQILNPSYGLLNTALSALGLPTAQWLQSSSTALGCIIFIAIWKGVGYYSLIILGAMQGIPTSIYEAASLDNAGKFLTLRKITIPMISPQLFFTLIVMTIGSFKVFDIINILTGGGPNYATSSLVVYIYQKVFTDYDIGCACAAGVVLLLIVGVFTIIYFGALSKKVHYQ